jgi:hypothetical protein
VAFVDQAQFPAPAGSKIGHATRASPSGGLPMGPLALIFSEPSSAVAVEPLGRLGSAAS